METVAMILKSNHEMHQISTILCGNKRLVRIYKEMGGELDMTGSIKTL